MAVEQKVDGKWWQRLSARLRPRCRRRSDDELPPAGRDGLLVSPAVDETNNEAAEKESNTLARWPKRDTALTRLQEGYDRVNQLMADMQQHMAAQSERTERMCAAIEKLSRAMGEWPEVASEQTHLLQSILGQAETAQVRSEQWSTTLEAIPKAVKAQETTLNGISRHLEMMAEQSVVESRTMEKFSGTIQKLDEQEGHQTRLLHEVVARLAEQSEQFQSSVTRGTRRFTALWVATLVLAAGALAAAVLAIVGS